ncbi:hypothetical protein XENTR_v10002603 [Xenopus tropicalis]|nr:hypothetical protein XENTR_v10002603 [Xenopus tropicalis]
MTYFITGKQPPRGFFRKKNWLCTYFKGIIPNPLLSTPVVLYSLQMWQKVIAKRLVSVQIENNGVIMRKPAQVTRLKKESPAVNRL